MIERVNWGITMVDETDFERGDIDLEQVFLKARQTTPQMSQRLQDAVLADALAFLPQSQVETDIKAKPETRTSSTDSAFRMLRRNVKDIVGGWHALGGLAVASVVGVWFGAAPPTFLGGYQSLALATLYGDTSFYDNVLDDFDLAIVLNEDLQ